ncbi:MAG: sporulation protein YabP [Lachnospiraceae bacterium]|nr:sporulation protein YabP [Lachnospiraceae bacterium]
MEERQAAAKSHKIELLSRKTAMLTGVKDVSSFDEKEILLETVQGTLIIRGAELHVNRLNLEKGEVDVDGRVDSMTYIEQKDLKKSGESFLTRLFR